MSLFDKIRPTFVICSILGVTVASAAMAQSPSIAASDRSEVSSRRRQS
jgi:hypothetical protein